MNDLKLYISCVNFFLQIFVKSFSMHAGLVKELFLFFFFSYHLMVNKELSIINNVEWIVVSADTGVGSTDIAADAATSPGIDDTWSDTESEQSEARNKKVRQFLWLEWQHGCPQADAPDARASTKLLDMDLNCTNLVS